MDTENLDLVSYLTINNETREIADQACRNVLNTLEESVTNFKDRIEILESLTDAPDYNFNINNYKQLSTITKLGKAEEYVNVGDQVMVTWHPDDASTGFYILPFDVVDINAPILDEYGRTISNNIWLQSHYALRSILFSGISDSNAFYVPENELEAGTYFFTVRYATGPFVKDESYNFTLTQNVSAKGQLVFSWTSGMWGNNLSYWKVKSYNSGMDSNPIETVSLETGEAGIKIGDLEQYKEYTTTGMNSITRIRSGYNRYSLSCVRQWCNGIEGAGSWWKPLNLFDRCPSFSRTTKGFVAGLPQDFINIINPVQVITKLNTTSDKNIGEIETTVDRFFIPTLKQININLAGYSSYDGEEVLSYWQGSSSSDRIYYSYDNNTSTKSIWTRTPVTGSESSQYSINTNGSNVGRSSYYSLSVTPMCVIY